MKIFKKLNENLSKETIIFILRDKNRDYLLSNWFFTLVTYLFFFFFLFFYRSRHHTHLRIKKLDIQKITSAKLCVEIHTLTHIRELSTMFSSWVKLACLALIYAAFARKNVYILYEFTFFFFLYTVSCRFSLSLFFRIRTNVKQCVLR